MNEVAYYISKDHRDYAIGFSIGHEYRFGDGALYTVRGFVDNNVVSSFEFQGKRVYVVHGKEVFEKNITLLEYRG
jgi:hypothetical protein